MKTSSKEAVDLFGKLLPGGISCSDGLQIRKKRVEDYKSFVDAKAFRDSLKADVFHVFDDNGVYKQGAGEQGINSLGIVSVWTNRLLILRKDGFIQRCSKCSMRGQSRRREADLELFYFNSGATEKARENDENKSSFTDLEYIMICNYCTVAKVDYEVVGRLSRCIVASSLLLYIIL